jgi:hypothetical protein
MLIYWNETYKEKLRSFIILEVNHTKTKNVFMSYEHKKIKVVPVHAIEGHENKGVNPLIRNISARWR